MLSNIFFRAFLRQAMTPEQQEIQSLKKQLWRSQRDNEILKKAIALFAVDNQNTL